MECNFGMVGKENDDFSRNRTIILSKKIRDENFMVQTMEEHTKNKYLPALSYYSCSAMFGVFEQLKSEDHGYEDGSSGLMVERQREKEMGSEENTRGNKLGKMKGSKREEEKK